uniref:Uncharacterized protein n=1 Tax=Clytia hemisphaerica TaxID=252671 RepID=A0A7M5V0G4_9CNID
MSNNKTTIMAHSNHSNATQHLHTNAGAISIVAVLDIALMVIAMLLNLLAMVLQISTLKMKILSNQSILLIHLNLVSFFNIATNAWSVAIFGYDVGFSLDFLVTYQAAYVAYYLTWFY